MRVTPPMVRTGRGYPLPSQVGVLPSTPGDTHQVLEEGYPYKVPMGGEGGTPSDSGGTLSLDWGGVPWPGQDEGNPPPPHGQDWMGVPSPTVRAGWGYLILDRRRAVFLLRSRRTFLFHT